LLSKSDGDLNTAELFGKYKKLNSLAAYSRNRYSDFPGISKSNISIHLSGTNEYEQVCFFMRSL